MKIILKKIFLAYFFKDEFMFIFMDICVFASCMSLHHIHEVSLEARRTSDPLKSAVTDSCEPAFGYWESISDPLEEQTIP